MKAQSDLIEQGILGIVVGLVVVKVLFGGAAMVAMVHSYIAVTVICAVLFAIAALVFTIHGRWHRWRHPPKPPMTAEERARRRAARGSRWFARSPGTRGSVLFACARSPP